MHMDPALPMVVLLSLLVLSLGLLMRVIRQPAILAYLAAGIILGPEILGLITDEALIQRLGEFGVVMLLFFIGMEIVPERLFSAWRIAVFGTLLQIILSMLLMAIVGYFFDWSITRIILLGFMISLSSTAVVLNLLNQYQQLGSRVGQAILGILLTQDLAVILMMVVVGFFVPASHHSFHWLWQVLGALIMIATAVFLVAKKSLRLPWARPIKKDHELQIFAALVICFGFAYLSSVFGLSTALGAFLGGMLIGRAKETQWVHKSLEPFKVVFVALFFVSLGLLIQFQFIQTHWLIITLITALVLMSNLFINAIILKGNQFSWQESLFAGAALSPIGEFSFLIASIGLQMRALTQFGYQLAITVIVITLLLSPIMISMARSRFMSNTASDSDAEPDDHSLNN